jgi:type I site-specific restriction endonuclease
VRAEYDIPFVYSSNGRPYLCQLETQSGIWFVDVCRPPNMSHTLDGWYTPEGLKQLLKQDVDLAQQQLAAEPFDYPVIVLNAWSIHAFREGGLRKVKSDWTNAVWTSEFLPLTASRMQSACLWE